jgi:CRISPR/Cas system-associated endoribonuclease Cas2
MAHDRLVADRDHRLGYILRIVADAGAETAAEQHNLHDTLRLGSMTSTSGMGTLNIINIEVRSMAPQVAVGTAVLASTKGVGETDQEYPPSGQRGSFVMANRGGSWKIAQFHLSTLAPGLFKGELSRAKREKIKAGVENYRKEGKDSSAIAELMQQADRLTKDRKFYESEAMLDKALGLLGDTVGETAQPQQTTGNAKPAEQDRKHPAEIAKIASVSPTFPVPAVRIGFQNNSSGIRKVYWLDQKGERQLRRELEPGQGYGEPSYLINPWVVTDADGNALGLYFPDGQKRIVNLE